MQECDNLQKICPNFDRCKGERNTNKYQNCKTHRNEKYCPFYKVNYFFYNRKLNLNIS